MSGPGKRRALADWLTDRRNPRTARVMANRLWQYHFGRGIVPTPNDFGKLGEPATHPELLDWLAAELMDGGWRLKRMHRLIVLSSAYRMSSRASKAELAADPANRWFWRFPMRRLTAEEVRDSILAVSGSLNLKAGGTERLSADPARGPGRPIGARAGLADLAAGGGGPAERLRPRQAVAPGPDPGDARRGRHRLQLPRALYDDRAHPGPRPAQRRVRQRAGRSPSPTGFAGKRPDDLAGQVRRAIRLTTAREPVADEVRDDVEFRQTADHGVAPRRADGLDPVLSA